MVPCDVFAHAPKNNSDKFWQLEEDTINCVCLFSLFGQKITQFCLNKYCYVMLSSFTVRKF
jgi:hypothetical protein